MMSGLYFQTKHFTYQLEKLSPSIVKATTGILSGIQIKFFEKVSVCKQLL